LVAAPRTSSDASGKGGFQLAAGGVVRFVGGLDVGERFAPTLEQELGLITRVVALDQLF